MCLLASPRLTAPHRRPDHPAATRRLSLLRPLAGKQERHTGRVLPQSLPQPQLQPAPAELMCWGERLRKPCSSVPAVTSSKGQPLPSQASSLATTLYSSISAWVGSLNYLKAGVERRSRHSCASQGRALHACWPSTFDRHIQDWIVKREQFNSPPAGLKAV